MLYMRTKVTVPAPIIDHSQGRLRRSACSHSFGIGAQMRIYSSYGSYWLRSWQCEAARTHPCTVLFLELLSNLTLRTIVFSTAQCTYPRQATGCT
ncbi:hypothetical protein AMATHDRAFT_178359 [Amanita thiersii Skay4041]|uniref:Uncharacterized protein n=1 Tax=Amanita thiersii Skay4041 TaxID=703135 RepID=A0A2A9NFC5_9AGAR|nr:hypothetical protein AMATHDRAFT_178359 [Amanita thiersii Skay4041]